MKYYIIAGEASGDLHGANLMRALAHFDNNAEFRFWGGDLMQQVQDNLVMHYKNLAFMGFIEVVKNIDTITKNLAYCKKDILNYQPDAIIFIDYPGFNLRIAKWAKKKGFKTHYYISPQIWAWKENRIKAIKRDIDNMYVILPFEKQFYENKHQFPVHFVGHPLIDAIAKRKSISFSEFITENNLNNKPIIAVLPGSRKQEIKKVLKVMLSIIKHYPDYQFVIAGAPSLDFNFYKPLITGTNAKFISNKTYDLLNVAHAAVVTSGTATLETALFKVPEVVCYKGSWISYRIGKMLVRNIKFIALINLILNREAVTELIQSAFNSKRLKKELDLILEPNHRKKLQKDYKELEEKLGGEGASNLTAQLIYKTLK